MTQLDRTPMPGSEVQGYGAALLAGFCFAIGSRLAEALWQHASTALDLDG